MIYDAARARRLCTKFQVNMSKNKDIHFGGSFLWRRWGAGDLTAVNIKSWLTLAMAKRTQIWILVMIGPIGWEEFDDRQTDRQNVNPSMPYDTFACLIMVVIFFFFFLIYDPLEAHPCLDACCIKIWLYAAWPHHHYQACKAGEGIIGHRGIWFVCCLSIVCLSSICHQFLPAYGTNHNQNALTGSSGHCEGQSRFDIDHSSIPAPQKMTPKMKIFIFWRIDLKFCT